MSNDPETCDWFDCSTVVPPGFKAKIPGFDANQEACYCRKHKNELAKVNSNIQWIKVGK